MILNVVSVGLVFANKGTGYGPRGQDLHNLHKPQMRLIYHYRKIIENTPGTAGGPGGRDPTLAVKSRKNFRKFTFFSLKNKMYPKKIFFFAYIF